MNPFRMLLSVPLLALVLVLWLRFGPGQLAVFHAWNGDTAMPLLWAHLTLLGDALTVLALMLPLSFWRPTLAVAMMLCALLLGVLVHELKDVFDTLRPLAVLGRDAVQVIGPELGRHSFPSGHSATAFAVAAMLLVHLRTPSGRAGVLVLAALVALSRCVVGAHWPLDILAGAAVGWLVGCWISAWVEGFSLSSFSFWLWTARLIGLLAALMLLTAAADAASSTAMAQRVLALVVLLVSGWMVWRGQQGTPP